MTFTISMGAEIQTSVPTVQRYRQACRQCRATDKRANSAELQTSVPSVQSYRQACQQCRATDKRADSAELQTSVPSVQSYRQACRQCRATDKRADSAELQTSVPSKFFKNCGKQEQAFIHAYIQITNVTEEIVTKFSLDSTIFVKNA